MVNESTEHTTNLLAGDLKTALEHLTMFVDGIEGEPDSHESSAIEFLRLCELVYSADLTPSLQLQASGTPVVLVDTKQATVGVRYACGHSLRIPVHSDVVEAPVMCANCMARTNRSDAQMYQNTRNDNAALAGALADAVELFDCLLAGEEDAEDRVQAWLAQNRMAFVETVEGATK